MGVVLLIISADGLWVNYKPGLREQTSISGRTKHRTEVLIKQTKEPVKVNFLYLKNSFMTF